MVQLSCENEVINKPSYQGYPSRISLKNGIGLVCLLLLASYFVSVTLNPMYKMRGLDSAVQEPLSQLNASVKPPSLNFMDGKNVVLVSHELSLSGETLKLHCVVISNNILLICKLSNRAYDCMMYGISNLILEVC